MAVLVECPIDFDFLQTPLKQLDEEILVKHLKFFRQGEREGEGQRFTGHISEV